jgi:tetratricopeptide (TPR) repeat protein
MATPEFFKNTLWVGSEFLKIFYSPVGVAGGFIDAFRGWKFSRSWVRFWFHLPSLILLSAVYVIFGFSFFSRVDSRVQTFSVESEKQCPTKELEAISDQLREESFCKALDVPFDAPVESKLNAFTDLKKHYVELLSKRVLSIDPTNQAAHYRLGLIYSLEGEQKSAVSEMTELSKGQFGECPQASAWMAKNLLVNAVAGAQVSPATLLGYLEKAIKWKEADVRLISFYSKLLEKTGETEKAISVARQATKVRPELKLELARIYARHGSKDEVRVAATEAEEIFNKRLNTSGEKESDRLAVAEAHKLMDQLDKAAEVLIQGLSNKVSVCGPATKRELSEIQRLIYVRSIFKSEAGEFHADVELLEKAAETDPLNPNISGEIANLLRLKLKPTKALLGVLRKQLEAGVGSVAAHIALAEGLFVNGNVKDAMKNWEIALRKDPNNLSVLNNYALCLAKESETNVPRSLEMINKAISLAPGNAEVMDTLGDILMVAKRPQEAVSKYELAIRYDKTRNSTRKKLVTAYRSIGMEGLANTFENVLKESEEGKPNQPNPAPAPK